MPRKVVIRPAFGRYVTDRPRHMLHPVEEYEYAIDAVWHRGVFEQRSGWAYDGTVADGNTNQSVYRAKFVLANTTRTLITDLTAGIRIHNPSSSATTVGGVSGTYLPRCMYRDCLFFCSVDGSGVTTMYSGAQFTTSTTINSAAYVVNTALVDGTGITGSAPGVGSFVMHNSFSGGSYGIQWGGSRIMKWDGTAFAASIESTRALTGTALSSAPTAQDTARMVPCIAVYNAGTISVAASAGTGNGTLWQSGSWGGIKQNVDHTLINTGSGTWQLGLIAAVSSDTAITTYNTGTNAYYEILRPPTFQDCTAHKGSLWGSGIIQFPSRVYVGPPGWNPGYPPGAVYPFDPSSVAAYADPGYLKMDYIDVPNESDANPVVAILPSPDPLWVLKRGSIHGIYGSFPNFSQSLIASGVGCIDLRSAISVDEGLFFAGEQGVFFSPDGRQLIDLTRDRMNAEWRALMRSWGGSSYVATGVAHGYLVVSGNFGGTLRGYLYDLRRREWVGQLSNISARYMFSARVSGEIETLYVVQDSNNSRVINFAPALNLSGIAKDGDGTSPRMKWWSSGNLKGDITGEARLLTAEIDANVYDVGAAGSTKITGVVEHSGGLLSGGAGVQSQTMTTLDSDTTDLVDRHERTVNRSGRLLQMKLDTTPTGTNDVNTKAQLSEVRLSIRDFRERA